jgi:DNA-binding NtrC family response regulator
MTQDEPQSPPAARKPVLLVDDEFSMLDIMKEGLAAEFDVETAGSAAEAETRMAARRYAVIVCDHLMPGELGLGFLERMRERHPGTRRILLTGYMNAELISRSIALAELSACLLKPIHLAALTQAVRDAAGGQAPAERSG